MYKSIPEFVADGFFHLRELIFLFLLFFFYSEFFFSCGHPVKEIALSELTVIEMVYADRERSKKNVTRKNTSRTRR